MKDKKDKLCEAGKLSKALMIKKLEDAKTDAELENVIRQFTRAGLGTALEELGLHGLTRKRV